MDKLINFNDVSFEYLKVINTSTGLKENILKYITNFGRNAYKEEKHEVLNHLNFKLENGDRLCIIGKNGAGKSTLLRLITGIYRPTQGQVNVQGKISSLIEIGAGMDPELTGRENIYIMGLISGFSKKEIRAKEQEIIDFADIGDYIDVPVKYYSTGMGGRLSFSMATSIHPDILVVDELFAGGDINFINKASTRIEQIKQDASIFVSVTHDMKYAKQFFNKILYLKNNQMEYFGTDIESCINQYINDNVC
ncbi:ABC transporter ATP-binding protein [Cysteiniphilum sp. JM-1]|uniref:ABC transporter ATP-binding protein n=1 Tax=Cysteiniphilum TaxID=2056696 RepID=UPI001244075E|nr:ABC transporter ATP-binding protein [Cysteiniphilum sp. JM-1]